MLTIDTESMPDQLLRFGIESEAISMVGDAAAEGPRRARRVWCCRFEQRGHWLLRNCEAGGQLLLSKASPRGQR